MKTIKTDIESILEIEKSKFITILRYIDNINDVKTIIKDIKAVYPKANHYCYAYILDNDKKCSDNGEPSGTAGMPILNVLESNNLNHILAIVVRYFGGIKLGAGGLVRAYTKAITTTLNKTIICDLIEGINIDITYSYNNSKDIEYLLKDYNVINKNFTDTINQTLEIDIQSWNNIEDELNKLCLKVEITNKLYIKKQHI